MTAPKGLEGKVIAGRYEIVSLLGAGNFASVWKATQKDMGGDVAVKVLSPGYGTDPDLVDDFITQAKAYVAFRDDPRIATILDCGHDLDTGLNFVAMTLLEETVDAMIARSGPFPPDRVFRVAEDVGAALRSIHHKGLVHGDIKGTNVMTVAGDGRYVLTDFVVGLPDSADGTAPTLDMGRVANWAYASPEKIQATSRRDLTPASDLYSLGVLLFRLATGRYPFESRFPQVVHDHLRTPPPDPRSLRPDLPPGLSQLILRCLAKDPADRFLDVDDFGRAVMDAKTVQAKATLFGHPRSWVLGGFGGLAGLFGLAIFLLWPRGIELPLRAFPEDAEFRLYEGEMESRFDATQVGTTPVDIRGLKEGTYTVVVEKPGYFPKTQRIDVKRGMPAAVVVLEEQHEIRVSSDPSGAEATLQPLTGDRKKFVGGATPTDFSELRSGPYELVLRLENYATLVETLEVGKGRTDYRSTLQPGQLVPLAVLSSPPGATVSLDGTPADVPTPCKINNLLVGTYEIRFMKEEYAPFDTTFVLRGDPGGDTLFVELARSGPVPSTGSEDTTTQFGAAERREDARADQRSADLREKVRNHVKREEWVEADRALQSLLGLVSADAETDGWKSRIGSGLTKARANQAANDEAARKGVRATLGRYEAALESRSIESFTRLWVSLQPSEREKFERALTDIRSQEIQITEGTIIVNGSRATVDFHEVRKIVPNEGKEIVADRNRTMTLHRMGSGEWLIESMR